MSNLYLRLAKTNIRNNRQLYLPYLISGIVTVAMFYLMIFINNNPGMKTIPGAANLKMIMSMGVGIIAIFVLRGSAQLICIESRRGCHVVSDPVHINGGAHAPLTSYCATSACDVQPTSRRELNDRQETHRKR